MKQPAKHERIIFFDGVCVLCNHAVDIILKNDRKGKFSLAAMQSEFAGEFFRHRDFDANQADSITLFDEGRYYIKSEAVLRIARHLGFPYKIFWIFILLPRPFRDGAYQFIAGKRYRWFGKRTSCRVPDEASQGRIIG